MKVQQNSHRLRQSTGSTDSLRELMDHRRPPFGNNAPFLELGKQHKNGKLLCAQNFDLRKSRKTNVALNEQSPDKP